MLFFFIFSPPILVADSQLDFDLSFDLAIQTHVI